MTISGDKPLSLRIDLDPESRIGPGKIELLEKVIALGSISAAGRAMNMSYRRAWELIEAINVMCGSPAVEARAGGEKGGGARVTPLGHAIVTRYRAIEKAAALAAEPELQALRREIASAARRHARGATAPKGDGETR